jgi:hypothetical protein
MEPISPELCLVDPVLARRARALLPSLEDVGSDRGSPPEVVLPAEPPAPRGRLTRLGAWLLVPSVVLNVALLWPRSPSGIGAAWSPAPPVARSPVKRPPAARPAAPRTGGVLAAKTAPRLEKARRPATPRIVRGRRVLSWPATAGATSYDLVLWRGHRRVADLWPKKPGIAVTTVACSSGRRLPVPLVRLPGRRSRFPPLRGARALGRRRDRSESLPPHVVRS